jgi:DNA-binding NarL/FixJ family response regulator
VAAVVENRNHTETLMNANVEVGSGRSEEQDRSLSLFGYSESIGEAPAKTRILILDEQPLLRQGISAYLNSQPDMMVSGEAGSISEARDKIADCQPQLLLTALRLGTGDSLTLIKQLKTEAPWLPILVYSAFEESVFADRAIRAGANGYVMKRAPEKNSRHLFAKLRMAAFT